MAPNTKDAYQKQKAFYRRLKRKFESTIYELDRRERVGHLDVDVHKMSKEKLLSHYKSVTETIDKLDDLYKKAGNDYSLKREISYKIGGLTNLASNLHDSYKSLPESTYMQAHKRLKEHMKYKDIEGAEGELEEKLAKAAAVFLLVTASASFGFAMLNSTGITGSTIGIASGNSPSLLLSTFALIIIIIIVSPSGKLKGLFKKKRR